MGDSDCHTRETSPAVFRAGEDPGVPPPPAASVRRKLPGPPRLAAGLLAGAALLAGAGGAQAQTVIWEAEMVAEEFGICAGYRQSPTAGSLSNRTVTYKDDSYTITEVCEFGLLRFDVADRGVDLRNLLTSDVSFDFDGTVYGSHALVSGSYFFFINPPFQEVLADSSYTLKFTTTEPGAPRNLAATPLSAGSIRLNWTVPSSVGGSAITGYDYRTSTDGGANWGAWTAINNSASLTSFVLEELAGSTTYTVQIRATNSSGAGLYSETADATTTTACGTLPEVTTHEDGSATIYSACLLAGEESDESNLGYNVLDGWGRLAPNAFAAGTDTVGITGLYHNNSEVLLFALGAGGHSFFSALGTVEELKKRLVLHLDSHTLPFSSAADVSACCPKWTKPATLNWSVGDTVVVRLDRLSEPSAPPTLTATAESSTQVTLTWSAPAQSGGADVTGYEYRASADGGTTFGEWTAIENSAGLTSAVVGGLTAATAYTFELRAVNSVGCGDPSPTAAATTTSGATRPSVSSVVLSDAGADGVYAIDDSVSVTVTFSDSVDVTGTPQLDIDVDGSPETLSYDSGTGTDSLLFKGYVVAENDAD